MKKLFLLLMGLFLFTNLLLLSGCGLSEEEWNQISNSVSNAVSSGPYFPPPVTTNQGPTPYITIDSASSKNENSLTLWMSLHFNVDSTLILKNFSVNYWESDAQSPEVINKMFEVNKDTVDFENLASKAFSFSASFDSLKTETSYQFCFVGRDYYLSEATPAGSIQGHCGTYRTKN